MLLKDTRRQEAEKFENKLKLILDYSRPQPSKRPRLDEAGTSAPSANVMVDDDDEWVSSILLHQEKVKVQEKEEILAEMRGQMTELEFQVADLTRKNKDLTEKVSKAEEAQRKVEKECAEKVAKADSLTEAATKDAEKASEDLGHSVLLETLSQQLQEAKDKLKHQGEQYINITIYYVVENTQTCQQLSTECKISDNACQYGDGTGFYKVAHGDNYHVLYTPRGGNVYTLEIYAENFQRPQEIEDLPQNIRNKIEAACGSDSVKSDFYSRHSPLAISSLSADELLSRSQS